MDAPADSSVPTKVLSIDHTFLRQFRLGNNLPIHIRENTDFPRQLTSAETKFEVCFIGVQKGSPRWWGSARGWRVNILQSKGGGGGGGSPVGSSPLHGRMEKNWTTKRGHPCAPPTMGNLCELLNWLLRNTIWPPWLTLLQRLLKLASEYVKTCSNT